MNRMKKLLFGLCLNTSYYDSNYGCIITSGVRILKDKISTTFTSFHDKNGNYIPAGRFLS